MEEKQGYTTKTVEYNGVTIVVHRPIIDEGERKKRTQRIVDGLGHSLRDYLTR